MGGSRDDLYREAGQGESNFAFDSNVAGVFGDMVRRSVPGYQEIQDLIKKLAPAFIQPRTSVFDLGCSLGTTLREIARVADQEDVAIIGIDSSQPMIDQARLQTRNELPDDSRLQFRKADILTELDIAGASVVVMCLVLQFIRPPHRARLLREVRAGMVPGGCLLMVEKTVQPNARLDALYIDSFHAFKAANGYLATEIARKRVALENVLVPYSDEENRALLSQAGFDSVSTFYQWLNFTGYIAIAGEQ